MIDVDETVSIGNESSSSPEDGASMITEEDSISCFKHVDEKNFFKLNPQDSYG